MITWNPIYFFLFFRQWMWLLESYILIAVSKMISLFTTSLKNLLPQQYISCIVPVITICFMSNKIGIFFFWKFLIFFTASKTLDFYKIVQIDGKANAFTQQGTLPGSGGPQVDPVSSMPASKDSVEFGLVLVSWTDPPTGATSIASRTSWLSLFEDFRWWGDWCWVVYKRSLRISSRTLLPQSASFPQPPWPPVPM